MPGRPSGAEKEEPVISGFARRAFERRHRQYLDLRPARMLNQRGCRFQAWHEMLLELSCAVNPAALVTPRNELPPNLAGDHLPASVSFRAEGRDRRPRAVRVDPLPESTANVYIGETRGPLGAISRSGGAATAAQVEELSLLYLEAGRRFTQDGDHSGALRCYLNHARLSPEPVAAVRRETAACLLEMGELEQATHWYAFAAEQAQREGDLYGAADSYLHAGLCREAQPDATDEVFVVMDGQGYDSRRCLQLARELYRQAGYNTESLRAMALEADARRRWSPSPLTRLFLRGMQAAWLYGTSPIHVLACLAFAWLVPAVVYYFGGFNYSGEVIRHNPGVPGSLGAVWDVGKAMYLSMVTLCTIGYGDATPVGLIPRLAAAVQGICGVIFPAMLVVALDRRL
jgi:tetratricopeptide (TPR) repeat protein